MNYKYYLCQNKRNNFYVINRKSWAKEISKLTN